MLVLHSMSCATHIGSKVIELEQQAALVVSVVVDAVDTHYAAQSVTLENGALHPRL
jgi:hypothetical protein